MQAVVAMAVQQEVQVAAPAQVVREHEGRQSLLLATVRRLLHYPILNRSAVAKDATNLEKQFYFKNNLIVFLSVSIKLPVGIVECLQPGPLLWPYRQPTGSGGVWLE